MMVAAMFLGKWIINQNWLKKKEKKKETNFYLFIYFVGFDFICIIFR